jgi:hypothetical protein
MLSQETFCYGDDLCIEVFLYGEIVSCMFSTCAML